jgi:IS30 family transposase
MSIYKQLTQGARYQIYALKKTGHSNTEIARVIGCHKSTICRELTRNRGKKGYRPKQAHYFAMKRFEAKFHCRISQHQWRIVDILLKRDWSPEQISHRLTSEQNISISHERIYQHIYADKQSGGSLYRHLRCQKKRRKRYGSYDRRGLLPGRTFIDQRPGIVNSRNRIGDWEGDTIIGKGHQGSIVTLTERKSGFLAMRQIKRRTAHEVREAIIDKLAQHKNHVHTITTDNGKEFADHQVIADSLDAGFYFAHPYSSWERGTNENTNGLIRQYFPKNMVLSKVSPSLVDKAEELINNRPRKRLDYLTPYEVFFDTKTFLTVALTS